MNLASTQHRVAVVYKSRKTNNNNNSQLPDQLPTPEKTQHPRRRHPADHTDQRTTIRIPQTQNSAGTHPPKILAPQDRHDDQLHALTLACYAAKDKTPEGVLARAW